MKTDDLHQIFLRSSGISTDTRRIEENSIFFALKGPNFNANRFAASALEKAASFAVIDEQPENPDERFIVVDDVLESLQQLARFHRRFLSIPIIGLTGSNGKTTTKELINAVLSKKYKTAATKGNLNNHIGVPLTLLSMTPDTEVGIVEMGANHRGEIAFLSEIAQPDIGYITNFGKAHLEGFGGFEGVIAGKSELYEHLRKNNRTIIINLDDPIQQKQENHSHTYSFGSNPDADLQVEFPSQGTFAQVRVDGLQVNSQLIGSYNAKNIAAALAIGRFMKVPLQQAKQAVEAYSPTNNRSQIIEKGSNRIILDAYNANPTSMAAALENFAQRSEAFKVAVLGDMFELGAVSEEEHQSLANKLEEAEIDQVFLIGEHFYRTSTTGRIKKFRTYADFKEAFDPTDIQNALLIIKGSRGMALERVLELL